MKTKKMKEQNRKTVTKDKILSKFTSGRTKAIKKRKKTLLLEYKLMNKNNKFIDRRIGEKNRGMTQEDRAMARFVAQQVKIHKKKQMFNLGNDEDDVLTHHGRTLEEIEKFDNPQSESEDDEDGKLEADFVKEAHFGGGLFTKVSSNENNHRRTIDQLIAESKMRKAERQQVKEETQNLTEKLDSDLKVLFPVVSNAKADAEDETKNIKPVRESYDVLVSELRFERIGKPCSKIKPEDQMAIEEKKRIEKLEKERLERMKRSHEPDDEEESFPAERKHQSADDLEDGLDLDIYDDEEDEQSEEDNDEEDSEDSDVEGNEKASDIGNKVPKKILKITTDASKDNSFPKNLSDLLRILGKYDVEKKVEVINDLVAESRIHKGVSNKERQIQFFSILLEYIDSLFKSSIVKDSWQFFSKLTPVLFELTQLCGDAAATVVFGIVKKKYDNFCQRKKQGATPDMLIFLKLVPVLFPASDFQHAVTTPSVAFICHILSENSCQTLDHIVKGLFTATVVLEYINLSNRYCPEAISFLRNSLYLAAPDFQEACPPVRMNNKILSLDKCGNNFTERNLQLSYSLINGNVPDTKESKVSIIYATVKLLSSFCTLYRDLSAMSAIFQPVITILEKLPVDLYPPCLQIEIRNLMNQIRTVSEKPLNYLVAERKRPKALRLYEPNIRPIIEGRSLRTVSQAKLEKEKLVHQYKREMKGALREIRKDKNFLSRVKLSEQAKKDAERREKVKQIFGWGQSQQSELKRMERQNRFVRRRRK